MCLCVCVLPDRIQRAWTRCHPQMTPDRRALALESPDPYRDGLSRHFAVPKAGRGPHHEEARGGSLVPYVVCALNTASYAFNRIVDLLSFTVHRFGIFYKSATSSIEYAYIYHFIAIPVSDSKIIPSFPHEYH